MHIMACGAKSMLLLFVMPSLPRPCSIPATTRYVHIYWASWIDMCPLLLTQCRNLLPSTQGSSKYNAIFTCQQTHHNIDTSVSNSQPITKLKQLVLKATWTTSHFPWFAYIYMLRFILTSRLLINAVLTVTMNFQLSLDVQGQFFNG